MVGGEPEGDGCFEQAVEDRALCSPSDIDLVIVVQETLEDRVGEVHVHHGQGDPLFCRGVVRDDKRRDVAVADVAVRDVDVEGRGLDRQVLTRRVREVHGHKDVAGGDADVGDVHLLDTDFKIVHRRSIHHVLEYEENEEDDHDQPKN